jgi:hypothetical protein
MAQMLDKKYSRVATSSGSNEEIPKADSEEDEDKKRVAASTEDKKPAATSTLAMIGSLKSNKTVVMEDEFDLLFGVDSADMQL